MDVTNLINAKLIGKTKFQRWLDRYQAEWNKPKLELVKAQMWKEIHPLVKAELEQRAPDVVKKFRDKYGE